MSWPIPKYTTAVDISNIHLSMARARYFLGKLTVLKSESIFETEEEKLKKFVRKFEYRPEDVVVTSVGMEMVIFIDVAAPMKIKQKDLMNLGRAEASRVLGIPMDNISVYPVGRMGGKTLFSVVKISDIKGNLVEKLKKLGFPEPDVVIFDAAKYLYGTSIPTHGNVVYIVHNFYKNYITLFLISESNVVGIRNMSLDLSRIFAVLNDRFNLSISEISSMGNLDPVPDVREFLKETFSDLALEVNREYGTLLRSSIIEIQSDMIDLISVISDPVSFSQPLSENLSNVMNVSVSIENVNGIFGLLKRGGFEFGKVKSLQRKK